MDILIQKNIRVYKGQLQTWVQKVRSARTFQDAARAARHEPHPSPLVRSLRSLYSADRSRAIRQIEDCLVERVTDLDPQFWREAKMLTQGVFPAAYSRIARMEIKARSATEHPTP